MTLGIATIYSATSGELSLKKESPKGCFHLLKSLQTSLLELKMPSKKKDLGMAEIEMNGSAANGHPPGKNYIALDWIGYDASEPEQVISTIYYV